MRAPLRLVAASLLFAVPASSGCQPTPRSVDPGPVAVAVPAQLTAVAVRAPAFSEPKWQRPSGPPLSLTASDGSGLGLTRLSARAVVSEPLAFTELHLSFENPRDRTIEGTFSMTLPPRASIARFAMRIGDTWQEGEVVERKAARRAYEDFLHKKQDPALLEQAAGNQFSARVFPIPARGVKEIIVSYTEELADGAPYALALKGLPAVADLDVAVSGDGTPEQAIHETGVAPEGDLVFDRRAAAPPDGRRSGNLVVARVRPLGDADASPDPVDGALMMVDTSGSRALGFHDEVRLVRDLAAQLAAKNPSATLRVACYDQTVEPIFDGTAAAFGDREVRAMEARAALGASNVEGALAWAHDHVAEHFAEGAGVHRVVFVTDGVATAGATEAEPLRGAVAGLRAVGVDRLDVVAVGGIRDQAALRSLVTAGLPRDGVVVDGGEGVTRIAQRLGAATRSGVAVRVEGATFTYPTTLDGMQPGDEALVYAEVGDTEDVRVSVDGAAAVPLKLGMTDAPLLERALAQAHIAHLGDLEAKEGKSPQLEADIVALAVSHRIVTPYTALLVLETDADFARYGIGRRGLADLLTLEAGRVVSASRTAMLAVETKSPVVPVPLQKTAANHAPSMRAPAAAPMAGAAPSPTALASAAAPFGGDQDRAGSASPPPPADREVDVAATTPAAAPVANDLERSGLARAAAGGGGASDEVGGLGAIGTLGHGAGTGDGQGFGSGRLAPAARAIARRPSASAAMPREPFAQPAPPAKVVAVQPYTGKLGEVMEQLASKNVDSARREAQAWHEAEPGDILALVALGESLEASHEQERAARAYGSLIDLFPARADIRRFAGGRLERIKAKSAAALALDTYAKAKAERPDHPSSHRLLAYALLRSGAPAKAFDAAVEGLGHSYPEGRFPGVRRILQEDVGLIGAAWAKAEPARSAEILERVKEAGGIVENTPSLRFVLTWETDANDVDFHIVDAGGAHAYYGAKHLASGGDLYADVTTGYGPECFTIRGPASRRSPRYTLQANYFSRGPMGYGMGKLEVIDHDGKGGLTFDERPYVVMVDHAFVDLGVVAR